MIAKVSPQVAALAVASPLPIAKEAIPRRWLPYAGAGALGLAAVSFSAAAVTGTIATQDPTGSTRAMAQSNGLLVAGTVLTAAACAAFIGWWRDAHGR